MDKSTRRKHEWQKQQLIQNLYQATQPGGPGLPGAGGGGNNHRRSGNGDVFWFYAILISIALLWSYGALMAFGEYGRPPMTDEHERLASMAYDAEKDIHNLKHKLKVTGRQLDSAKEDYEKAVRDAKIKGTELPNADHQADFMRSIGDQWIALDDEKVKYQSDLKILRMSLKPFIEQGDKAQIEANGAFIASIQRYLSNSWFDNHYGRLD